MLSRTCEDYLFSFSTYVLPLLFRVRKNERERLEIRTRASAMRRTLGGMLTVAVLKVRLMMEANQVRMRMRMLRVNRRVVSPRRGAGTSGRSVDAPRRRRRRCRGRCRRRGRRRGRRRCLVAQHVDLVVVLVVGIRGRIAARARLATATQRKIYGTFSG